MDGMMLIAGAWVVAMTAAIVFLLFKVDELVRRQAQAEVLLKRSMENQSAFAAMFEKAVSRTRAVKSAKGAKGK